MSDTGQETDTGDSAAAGTSDSAAAGTSDSAAADTSDSAPTASTAGKMTDAARKQRRRRIGMIALVAFVIVILLLPPLAAPFLRSSVEEALSEQLGVDGRVGRLSLSWFSGVSLRDVDFPAPGQEIRFHQLNSDVTIGDLLFGGDSIQLGDSLEVAGLRLRLDLREAAKAAPDTPAGGDGSPASPPPTTDTAQPLRLRVPRVELSNADVEVKTDAGTLTLVAAQILVPIPTTLEFGDGPPGFADRTTIELLAREGIFAGASTPVQSDDGEAPLRFQWQPSAATSNNSGDEAAASTSWSGHADGLAVTIAPTADGASLQGSMTLAELSLNVSNDANRWVRLAGRPHLDLHPFPANELSVLGDRPTAQLVAEQLKSLKDCALFAQWDDTSVRDLHFEANGDGTTTRFTGVGAVNDGTIEVGGNLTAATWQAAIQAEDVQTSRQVIDALARVSPFFVLVKHAPTQPRCLVGLNTSVSGRFGEDPLETVTGNGRLQTSAGNLQIKQGWEALVELIDRKNKGDTVLFKSFEQPFELSDGKILNSGFELATEQGSVLVEGYTTIAGTLHHDLRLDRILAKELGGKASRPEYELLAGALESQVVKLRGSVSQPDLQMPDVLQNPANFLEGLLKPGGSGSKAIEQGLDDLLEKGLDDLFGDRKKKKRKKKDD